MLLRVSTLWKQHIHLVLFIWLIYLAHVIQSIWDQVLCFIFLDITLIFIKNVKVRIKINHTGGLNICPFIRKTVKLVYMEIIPDILYIMITCNLKILKKIGK